MEINNSFHNLTKITDCDRSLLGPNGWLKPGARERLTADDCGNITHIDGRRVIGGDLVWHLEGGAK